MRIDMSSFWILGQEQAPAGGPSLIPLALMVGVVAIYYYLIIGLPQRRLEKQRHDMLLSLKKKDEVLTSGGIYGTVESVDEKNEKVTVRICDEPAVRIKVNARSIARVLRENESV
ncbi:preprotein translocase subunit YajC [bacterium]|nr:preprotein translocase subunit YajC [bacterium]